ncbi:hypothetical protein LJC63_12890 [Ruminococcaceae bacterium OttesenSCG-928-L11]|nr:hypothetical protein [Ruminococcaceae bacterium OttesenSCG-928-L11]
MTIAPIKTIPIPDRVSFIDMPYPQKHYVLSGKAGRHYVFDSTFEPVCRFETAYGRSNLSAIHPTRPLIAIMGTDEALHVVDFSGVDVWQKQGEYIAACWSPDGTALYALQRPHKTRLKLVVYDPHGEITAQTEFEDALYDSAAYISPIPCSREMTLQLMAGQDGCTTLFVSLSDSQITLTPLHKTYSYISPAFDDTGKRFLCIEGDESSVHHFRYPELQEIGNHKFDVSEANLDYTLIYLGETGIVRYADTFHLLDLATMKIADNLIIKGHEPVPTCEIYKNLKDDTTPICDITYMCSVGVYIIGFVPKGDAGEIVVLQKSDLL